MSNLMFGKELIDETSHEIDEKENQLKGDTRENMQAGVYDVFLIDTSFDTDPKGVHSIKLVHNVDKDAKTFKDLVKIYKFDLEDIDTDEKKKASLLTNQKYFIEYLKKSFNYTLKPGDIKQAFQQVDKFKGKELQVAVRVRERLMTFYVMENGQKTSEILGYKIIKISDLYYTGKIGDEKFTLKKDKEFVALKDGERQIYTDHVEAYPERYNNGVLIMGNNTTENAEPIITQEEKSKAKPAAKKEKVDEEKSTSFKANDDDDEAW